MWDGSTILLSDKSGVVSGRSALRQVRSCRQWGYFLLFIEESIEKLRGSRSLWSSVKITSGRSTDFIDFIDAGLSLEKALAMKSPTEEDYWRKNVLIVDWRLYREVGVNPDRNFLILSSIFVNFLVSIWRILKKLLKNIEEAIVIKNLMRPCGLRECCYYWSASHQEDITACTVIEGRRGGNSRR